MKYIKYLSFFSFLFLLYVNLYFFNVDNKFDFLLKYMTLGSYLTPGFGDTIIIPPRYKIAPSISDAIFKPVHRIDRMLREDYWKMSYDAYLKINRK